MKCKINILASKDGKEHLSILAVTAAILLLLSINVLAGDSDNSVAEDVRDRLFGFVDITGMQVVIDNAVSSGGLNTDIYKFSFTVGNLPTANYELLLQLRREGEEEWINYGTSVPVDVVREKFLNGNSVELSVSPSLIQSVQTGTYEFRLIGAPEDVSSDNFEAESKPYVNLELSSVQSSPSSSCFDSDVNDKYPDGINRFEKGVLTVGDLRIEDGCSVYGTVRDFYCRDWNEQSPDYISTLMSVGSFLFVQGEVVGNLIEINENYVVFELGDVKTKILLGKETEIGENGVIAMFSEIRNPGEDPSAVLLYANKYYTDIRTLCLNGCSEGACLPEEAPDSNEWEQIAGEWAVQGDNLAVSSFESDHSSALLRKAGSEPFSIRESVTEITFSLSSNEQGLCHFSSTSKKAYCLGSTKSQPLLLVSEEDMSRRIIAAGKLSFNMKDFIDKKISFKLRTEGRNVKGKIWPYGDKEPKEWSVEYYGELYGDESLGKLVPGYYSNGKSGLFENEINSQTCSEGEHCSWLYPSECGSVCGDVRCSPTAICSESAEREDSVYSCYVSEQCGASCTNLLDSNPELYTVKEKPCSEYDICTVASSDPGMSRCSANNIQDGYFCAGDCIPPVTCDTEGWTAVSGNWNCKDSTLTYKNGFGLLISDELGINRDFDITTEPLSINPGSEIGVCGRISKSGNGYCLIYNVGRDLLIGKLEKSFKSKNIELLIWTGNRTVVNDLKPESKIVMRFRSEEDTLLGKAWLEGDQEPVGWIVAAKDPSFLIGHIGYLGLGDNDNTFPKSLSLSNVCRDDTESGQCSTLKPLFCNEGVLENNNAVCGCPEGDTPLSDGSCEIDATCKCSDGSECAAGGICPLDPDWSIISGSWTVNDDEVTNSGKSFFSERIVNTKTQFTNGDVSTTVEDASSVYLCGRMDASGGGYCLYYVRDVSNAKLEIHKFSSSESSSVLRSSIIPLPDKKDVNMKLSFQDDVIKGDVWSSGSKDPSGWFISSSGNEVRSGFGGYIASVNDFNDLGHTFTNFLLETTEADSAKEITLRSSASVSFYPDQATQGDFVTVLAITDNVDASDNVRLVESNTGLGFALYDDGNQGDVGHNDGVYGTTISTSELKPGRHKFDLFVNDDYVSYSWLKINEPSDNECTHVLGTGNNVNFVVVPCLFKEGEEAEYQALVNEVSDALSETEPYKSNQNLFSLYSVSKFDPELLFDDATEDCWHHMSKIRELASVCPYDKIIVPAHNSGESGGSFEGSIAVAGSGVDFNGDDHGKHFKFTVLHELGHAMDLPHTCSVETFSVATDYHHPACGETFISEDQPCGEWNNEEYLRWGNIGCYPGCADGRSTAEIQGKEVSITVPYGNRYRPWKTNIQIMCRDEGLINDHNPVERKLLLDTLSGKR